MERSHRTALAIAALSLLLLYVLPIWRITLEAPQYPEGLGMVIMIDDIVGQSKNDLQNINGLNHYIGMKEIVPDSIPELRWMPIIIALLALSGIAAAISGKRSMLYAWTGAFLLLAIVGIVDFYLWEYDYGHDLDLENASIKIPGTSFQPPLIGPKRILNFVASSWPASGGWIAFASLATGLITSIRLYRSKGKLEDKYILSPESIRAAAVLVLFSGAMFAGCTTGPEDIEPGVTMCTHCRMPISDNRFAVQVETQTGKLLKYDAIECALAHGEPNVRQTWVRLVDGGTWVAADSALFVRDADIHSPMGGNLIAVSSEMTLDGPLATGLFGDEVDSVLRWSELSQLNLQDHSAQHADASNASVEFVEFPKSTNERFSLSSAILDAAAHDTIVVPPGTYVEPATVAINKPIVLIGNGAVEMRAPEAGPILRINADSVVVSGMKFSGIQTSYVTDTAALHIEDASACEVVDNEFADNFFAIYLASADNCLIKSNKVIASGSTESRSGNGIHLWYSRNVVVEDNIISGHRDGVYFEFVEDSIVRRNTSTGNLRYGLHFMFSDRCRYENNAFNANGAGVAVMYSEDVAIQHNDFNENTGSASFGLLLKEIDSGVVSNNNFVGNSVGIYAEGSDSLRIQQNLFAENGSALKLLADCDHAYVHQNDFESNTFDVVTNSRRSIAHFTENYWHNYTGYDLDRDGVGDVPHRPVRLFSIVAEQTEPTVILTGSLFLKLLDIAERVVPSITPTGFVDNEPSLRRWRT